MLVYLSKSYENQMPRSANTAAAWLGEIDVKTDGERVGEAVSSLTVMWSLNQSEGERGERVSGPAVYRRLLVAARSSQSKSPITGGWAPSLTPVGSVALELTLIDFRARHWALDTHSPCSWRSERCLLMATATEFWTFKSPLFTLTVEN